MLTVEQAWELESEEALRNFASATILSPRLPEHDSNRDNQPKTYESLSHKVPSRPVIFIIAQAQLRGYFD
jgi:hypothetical protein